MRTDLKVGVICLFALVLACVGFFAYHSNKPGKDVVAAPSPTVASSAGGLSMAPPSETPTTVPSIASGSSALTGFGPAHALGADNTYTISPPGATTAPSPSIVPPGSGSTSLSAPGGLNGGMGAPSSLHQSLVPPPASGTSSFGTSSNTSLTSGGSSSLLPPPAPSTAPSLTGSSNLGGFPSTSGTSSFGTSSPGSSLGTPSHGSSLEIGSTPSSSDFSSLSSSSSLSGTGGTYTIQKGDTFGSLAKKNHTTTKAILAANPGVNPNRLKVGQKITMPGASSSSSSSSSGLGSLSGSSTLDTLGATSTATTRPSKSHKGATTHGSHAATKATKGTKGKAPQASLAGGSYTIKKGDTLRKIAKSVYGDERLWRRIFRANRGDLASPNAIKPGQVIQLPK